MLTTVILLIGNSNNSNIIDRLVYQIVKQSMCETKIEESMSEGKDGGQAGNEREISVFYTVKVPRNGA